METPETINQRLLERFGKTDHGQNWRLSYSDGQIEKRRGTFAKHDIHGNYLGEFEGVQIVPKYPYIQHKYVLERFLYVPEGVETDLVDKFSYEPIWTFEDKHGNALPPVWEAIEVIIDTVSRAAARAVGAKYKETNEQYTVEELKRKTQIMDELFGNETKITDALRYKDGVSLSGKKLISEEEK